jgi:uncharacterized caspase-like protein
LLRKASSIAESKIDVGNEVMRQALRDFSEVIRNADIAVAFYAGHGIRRY